MTLYLTAGTFYNIYHVVLSVGATIIIGETIYQVASVEKTKTAKHSIKLSKKRSKEPIARRKSYNSRKKAKQAAKRAEYGKEPINHPKGCHGNKRPHYHPNVNNAFRLTPNGPTFHDHYYYPR